MRTTARSVLHGNHLVHQVPAAPLRRPGAASLSERQDTSVQALARSFVFKLSKGNYLLRLAPPGSPYHQQAADLLARRYATKGLLPPTFQPARSQHEHTLVALAGTTVVGTLTVGIDSSLGLLADTLYAPQLNQVRGPHAKLCEITRLAIDQDVHEPHLPSAIFSMGYLVSRIQYGMTDCLIEVHPRHVAYYARNFGYSIAGPEQICPRAGAPAVLMHAKLHQAERHLMRTNQQKGFTAPHFIEQLKTQSPAEAILST